MRREWIVVGHSRACSASSCCPVAASAQEDCPRGTLDKAYCDRNGDLVADLPTDPKKVINPSTLIFSYTPVEDPAVYQKVWDGFIKHLEKITGKQVRFLPGAIERRAIRGDALGPPARRRASMPAAMPIAVNCAGFVPFAMMAVAGQQLRLRDGNHRAGRQPDQDADRSQGPQDRVHRRHVELRIQGAVGDPRRPTSISKPSATSSRCFPASTTTRSSASSTRTTRPRRWRTRCSTGCSTARCSTRPRSARSTSRRPSRPPATATPTTSIRSSSRRSRKPSSRFPGRARRWQAEFKREGKFIPIDYKKDWAVLRKIDDATGVKYSLQVTAVTQRGAAQCCASKV